MHRRLSLRELVALLDDGRQFYEQAAANVGGADLERVFRRLASTKSAIAGALTQRLAARGESAPSDGTLGGHLRQTFGEIRAHFSAHPDATYVAQLEQFEDRIRDAFREVAGEADDADVRALAAKYMPDVLRDHSEISALKRQLAAPG